MKRVDIPLEGSDSARPDSCFQPCLIIPIYNHGSEIATTLERLAQPNLRIIIVDDGSDARTQAILRGLATDRVTVHRLPENSGKGAAVISGLRLALEQGFSHAVQVDADGQHELEAADEFLKLARCFH